MDGPLLAPTFFDSQVNYLRKNDINNDCTTGVSDRKDQLKNFDSKPNQFIYYLNLLKWTITG